MRDKKLQIRADDDFLAKVEYLRHINGWKSTSETVRKIIEKECMKEIPVPSAQQWIPVTERLPGHGEAVLTYNRYGDYEINHIIGDEYDGEWFWDGVVAWMPLPAPCRPEGDDQHEGDAVALQSRLEGL